ncbi:MAG: NeuD/PglB/VioB family sugar acetyltransferase [Bacteroidota bacterium]|nr:NeuD/PglB/VioB family sugar acetyltransferase [Bacteroidota bacterium]MDP4217154.1 NeuD/PglB/VioB family sugar acetyltransferase [Bacteroidota bacterium]MDP4247676.1 NeuD/PglB/VioB family sugar acetyltransferase [Bacteroidota bacterium]MDP4254766.1 NeuD/PglB/VioB family sugar acetyltransferase [Bacteroidota bacterium]MDP4260370.1 NeuD/PglB/VioB family sugar acetyltransferase [Bacteroidota bacterium]
MIIVGAGGHAKEILGVLSELGELGDGGSSAVFFYDDLSPSAPDSLFDRFSVLRTPDEAKAALSRDPRFILGIGKPSARQFMEKKYSSWGGRLTSVISPHARIGEFGVNLAPGVNVMTGAVITQDIVIGKGTILHIHCSVHHDCRIGEFCEISPGARILGKVLIGDLSRIGAGAVLLPGVRIGYGVTVGAGAVVTKDIDDGLTVKGIPAR